MPDISFRILSTEPIPHTVAPLLSFRIRIECVPPEARLCAIALRVQVRIEPARRRYDPDEQRRLVPLFGQPDRWRDALRPLLWAHTGTIVPAFAGAAEADLPVACTADLTAAAGRYIDALADGDVPLSLLFSGTAYSASTDGRLQAGPIPFNAEAEWRLPVTVWHTLVQSHFGAATWMCIRRDVAQRLDRFKSRCTLPTWEHALERLLDGAEEAARS